MGYWGHRWRSQRGATAVRAVSIVVAVLLLGVLGEQIQEVHMWAPWGVLLGAIVIAEIIVRVGRRLGRL